MSETRIDAIPVVGANHGLVGVATEKEIREFPEERRGEVSVSAVIKSQFTHCKPNDDLYAALRSMILANAGSIPDCLGRESMILVGVITRSDIGAPHHKNVSRHSRRSNSKIINPSSAADKY